MYAFCIHCATKNDFVKVFTNTKLKISAEGCIIRVRKRYVFFCKIAAIQTQNPPNSSKELLNNSSPNLPSIQSCIKWWIKRQGSQAKVEKTPHKHRLSRFFIPNGVLYLTANRRDTIFHLLFPVDSLIVFGFFQAGGTLTNAVIDLGQVFILYDILLFRNFSKVVASGTCSVIKFMPRKLRMA